MDRVSPGVASHTPVLIMPSRAVSCAQVLKDGSPDTKRSGAALDSRGVPSGLGLMVLSRDIGRPFFEDEGSSCGGSRPNATAKAMARSGLELDRKAIRGSFEAATLWPVALSQDRVTWSSLRRIALVVDRGPGAAPHGRRRAPSSS